MHRVPTMTAASLVPVTLVTVETELPVSMSTNAPTVATTAVATDLAPTTTELSLAAVTQVTPVMV